MFTSRVSSRGHSHDYVSGGGFGGGVILKNLMPTQIDDLFWLIWVKFCKLLQKSDDPFCGHKTANH